MPSKDDKEALKGSNDERVPFQVGDGTIPEAAEEDPDVDSSKVKFQNGGTGADAVVDIDGRTRVDNKAAFVGLTKDQLMEFEKDPYWVKVRWVLLILFWVIWVAMLVAAIVIIVLAPKCPPRPDLQWWQTSLVRQVYPRSFYDTNEDGTGDLGGIKEKLDYLKHDDLKASAIYINPIYPSGGADTGYDITNHTEIDPIFGDMATFEKLLKTMHKNEMKVILDYVPNHTSELHPWFNKSRNKEDPFTDYYVWHPGKTSTTGGRPDPPSNWRSVFGGEAWTWDDVRGEYYLHQFLKEQPDLNVRNAKVQEELKDILLFWLKKGVDGFRIDAVAHLFESVNLTVDEPPSSDPNVSPDDYDFLDHTLTQYQPETFALLTEWRAMIDKLGKDDGKHRMLMVESYAKSPNHTLSLFSYNDKPGAHLPTNMALLGIKQGCEATCVRDLVNGFMDPMEGTGIWANWQTGNHDNSRVATRLGGNDYVNAVNMLLLTLPGTAVSYYGEEIGMTDVPISDADKKDMAQDRDPERTPMQWTGEEFAGFTKGNSTWLPVASDYKTRNVMAQKAHGAGETPVEMFKEVSILRQEPSFQWGLFHSGVADGVYFYVRQAKGFDGYLVAINFGTNGATINFPNVAPEENLIPNMGQVVATTGNIEGASRARELALETEVTLDNLHIKPKEGLIFKWAPEAVGQQM